MHMATEPNVSSTMVMKMNYITEYGALQRLQPVEMPGRPHLSKKVVMDLAGVLVL